MITVSLSDDASDRIRFLLKEATEAKKASYIDSHIHEAFKIARTAASIKEPLADLDVILDDGPTARYIAMMSDEAAVYGLDDFKMQLADGNCTAREVFLAEMEWRRSAKSNAKQTA